MAAERQEQPGTMGTTTSPDDFPTFQMSNGQMNQDTRYTASLKLDLQSQLMILLDSILHFF